MFDAGGQGEGPQRDLYRAIRRDEWSGMEDERLRRDHMRTAAETGIAGRLRVAVIFILAGNFSRDITSIRLQQIAGKHLRCHEEQQKHRGEENPGAVGEKHPLEYFQFAEEYPEVCRIHSSICQKVW